MTAPTQALSDARMGVLAGAFVLGVWWQRPVVGAVVAGAVLVVLRPRILAAWAAALALIGGVLGERAWEGVAPDRLGPFSGSATLVDDPRPVNGALRVVLEIEGERFEAYTYGSARRRLERRSAGEVVDVVAERVPLRTATPRRAQVRHVVGAVLIERVGSSADGTPLARASNRVRDRLRDAADAAMGDDEAALFTGLVIGDDTRQRPEVIDAFRRAGMSHLTAVSGQNVAFVIVAAGIGLRRLSRWWRLAATCALIGWFAVITRLEPSVLRASTMAALSALGFALGRDRSTTRLLFVSVVILTAIDPLLVWSVGFWLSVTATFGVVAIAPLLEPRLRGPAWWRTSLAVLLGAQLAVLVPSWVVFGRVPALGLPANLLAVPVAGIVMLYGLPAGLVAPWLPAPAAIVAMAPATLGTTWVALVAERAADVAPAGAAAIALWIAQAALLACSIRRPRFDAGVVGSSAGTYAPADADPQR